MIYLRLLGFLMKPALYAAVTGFLLVGLGVDVTGLLMGGVEAVADWVLDLLADHLTVW
jgi:hypothetical protein